MSTPVITIFVRHTPGCKYEGDEFAKQCRCRKHLRWTHNGRQYRKTAGTRAWGQAEEAKRDLEAQLNGRAPVSEAKPVTIRDAADLFVSEKMNQGLTADSVQTHKRDVSRLMEFCEGEGVFVVTGLTMPVLVRFMKTAGGNYGSSYSRAFFQKRINMFLNFCKRAGWLALVPRLAPIKIDEPVTMPLTDAEYTRLLAVVTSPRVRACIQLMRWSGLAVRDAATLRRDQLQQDDKCYRIVTARQKTGTHVSVPIPPAIAEEVLAVVNNPTYLFWKRNGTERNCASVMGRSISAAFRRAKIYTEGHMVSHRLRDTFAVHYLSEGTPIEVVQKMLGHESILTTERHYSKWVKGRQDRLDNMITATWK